MRAFVLSGGGNLGPLQVGALRALFERDIVPEMLVGCSAGALNVAQLARSPDIGRVTLLADNWRATRLQDVYPGSRPGAFLRLVAGKDSLYDNRSFYAMLQRYGITPAHTFGNLSVLPFYITATDLRTGRLHVFGDDPNDRVLDALMASTALTPFHPPWEVNGDRYVDGGTVTPLPIRAALERGATEIYALHIYDSRRELAEPGTVRGVVGVLSRSVDTMLRLQAQHDLLLARSAKVRLHHILLAPARSLPFTNFGCTDELIEAGYQQTQAWLSAMPLSAGQASPKVPGLGRRISTAVFQWLSPRGSLKPAVVESRK